MRRVQQFILPSRDTTVGHWRFRGNLLDDSGQGNHLTPVLLRSYLPGYSENGLTSLAQAGEFEEGARLAAAEATDFDFGMESFTLEILHKPIDVYTDWPVRKHTGTSGPSFMVGLTMGSGGYRVCVYLHDGIAPKVLFSARTWSGHQYFLWEFWTVVIDRGNDQVRLYFWGVEDASSPFDISGLGSLSAPLANLDIGNRYSGEIDEVCISQEVLSPAAIAERAAGFFTETFPEDDDRFLLRFLPEVNHENPDLQELLIPFTRLYRELKDNAAGIGELALWDRCPDRFLDLLASRIGFELPHSSFASEVERRNLIRQAVWIYRHKGTAGTVRKFLDLVGYTYTISENYPAWVPIRSNRNRAFSRTNSAVDLFRDDFVTGNLSQWNQPLTLQSWWRVSGGRLLGTGDGDFISSGGITFNQTATDCFMQVTFEVLSGFDANTALGILLRHDDANNFARIELRRAVGIDYLIYVENIGGVSYTEILYTFPPSVVWSTGFHSLSLHMVEVGPYLTVAFDDTVLAYRFSRSFGSLSAARKGLYLNLSLSAAFSLVLIQSSPAERELRTLSSTWAERSLDVVLTNSPANDAAKRIYLDQVLPQYLPATVGLNLS